MSCDSDVGVKNLWLTLVDCDTGRVYSNVLHELANDEQPRYRMNGTNNEPMPGGFTRKTKGFTQFSCTVIRHRGIPLKAYQGGASIGFTCEHYNGLVYTGIGGSASGEEDSDGHEVSLTIAFQEKNTDEILPENFQQPTA